MIAQYLCNNMKSSLKQSPPIWWRLSLKDRVKPGYKNPSNTQPSTKHAFKATPPPLEFNQDTLNAYQIPGSCLEPLVKSWGWLVLKREILIFTLNASWL